jgi:hypothetical protein
MSASITTDVSNYEAKGYGDPSHRMKALTWQGKNTVRVGQSFCPSLPSFQALEFIGLADTVYHSGNGLPKDHR